MIVELIGLQEIQFTDSSGKVIKGKTIYTAFPQENVQGLRTEKFYIKDEISIPKDIKLHEKVDLSFNMKGKVESICKA